MELVKLLNSISSYFLMLSSTLKLYVYDLQLSNDCVYYQIKMWKRKFAKTRILISILSSKFLISTPVTTRIRNYCALVNVFEYSLVPLAATTFTKYREA